MDLSVVIPTYKEGKNISKLVFKLHDAIRDFSNDYEIIIVDGGSEDGTAENAQSAGAKVFVQRNPGYGNALKEGFGAARGDYIITMDGDLSHDPVVIRDLWKSRNKSDIVIASRYIKNGSADMPYFRKFLSLALNKFFTYFLSIPVKDISSGFRLYKASSIKSMNITGQNFDVLQEILVRAYSDGYSVSEIPFRYRPREHGQSKLRLIKFGMSYLKSFLRLWLLRNSVESVDYDSRAYYSRIPLQRFWQRKRHGIITGMLDKNDDIIDIGCGTSKIIQDLPDAVACDISMGRLRYLQQNNKLLVCGDVRALPFKDNTFDTVIFSNVIEHVPRCGSILSEINRILRAGGTLIVATPDYGKITWRVVEHVYDIVKLRGGYKQEHISQYDLPSLNKILKESGFQIIEREYICNSELVVKAMKNV
ncbi:MAG: glycosyltransferase [Methanosarcinales archaeon Met12]|nr:MAG: glycosyltransferase [Methanosarcinales archaeon Met12]